jgi:hypothetical protein
MEFVIQFLSTCTWVSVDRGVYTKVYLRKGMYISGNMKVWDHIVDKELLWLAGAL